MCYKVILPFLLGLVLIGCEPAEPSELLLLHFNGDYEGSQEEVGEASGTSFVPGKFGQGVLIDDTDTLVYPTDDNLSLAAGAIEFWVSMNQSRDLGEIHVLFEIDYHDQGIQIVKHGGGDLRYLMRRGEELTDIGAAAGDWRSGEWHHVAAVWTDTQMILYVDGWPRASSSSAAPPLERGPEFYLGSSPRGDWQADAIIDEFRISSIPVPKFRAVAVATPGSTAEAVQSPALRPVSGSAATWPAQPEPDFAFRLTYGSCFSSSLDTFEQTYRTAVGNGESVTIPLTLSEEQTQTIYQKMAAIDFFRYPETFRITYDENEVVGMVTPATDYHITVRNGERMHSVFWRDEISTPTNRDAEQLRELIQIILQVLDTHPDIQNLPELNFGCA